LIGIFGRIGFAIDDTLSNIAARWRAFNFVQFGVAMIRDIGSGILSLQSTLGQAAYTVISGALSASWGLVKTTLALPQKFFEVGVDIVKGIALGIKNDVGFVVTELQNLAGEMIAKLKSALKIGSPSKLTAELGGFAAQGIGVGWANEMPEVNAGMVRTVGLAPWAQPDRMLPTTPWMPTPPELGGVAPQGLSAAPPVAPAIPAAYAPGNGARSDAQPEREIVIRVKADKGTTAEVERAPKGAKIKTVPSGAD
jgi:hypothetical protein